MTEAPAAPPAADEAVRDLRHALDRLVKSLDTECFLPGSEKDIARRNASDVLQRIPVVPS
jgi:hypothetical protein